jgi:hypothetical protein
MDVSMTLAVAIKPPMVTRKTADELPVAFIAFDRGELELESPDAPTSPTAATSMRRWKTVEIARERSIALGTVCSASFTSLATTDTLANPPKAKKM